MIQALSEEKLEEITKEIPQINDEIKTLTHFEFGFNLHDLKYDGNLAISLVCLRDAYFRLNNAKISLKNAHIQKIWYQKYSPNSPSQIESIIFSKFYLDYVPLLLYAMQEDVAEFTLYFLNKMVEFNDWKKLPSTKNLLKRKSVTSNAGQTGLYLKESHSTNHITTIINTLINNTYWKQAINYRNTWVHDKPPIIENLGIQHSRKSRIEVKRNERSFGFGGSSKPDYNIEELFIIVKHSIEAASVLINELITIIDNKDNEIRIEIKCD